MCPTVSWKRIFTLLVWIQDKNRERKQMSFCREMKEKERERERETHRFSQEDDRHLESTQRRGQIPFSVHTCVRPRTRLFESLHFQCSIEKAWRKRREHLHDKESVSFDKNTRRKLFLPFNTFSVRNELQTTRGIANPLVNFNRDNYERRKRFEKTFFRSLSLGLTRFRSKIMRERERRRRKETCKETHLQTQSVLKDTFTSAATEVTSLDVKLDMVSSCFSRLHL